MGKKPKTPRAPSELGDAGRAFWNSMLKQMNIKDADLLELLKKAGVFLDRAALAAESVKADGMVFKDRWKQIRPNPAVEQERAAMNGFRMMLQAMRIADPNEKK